MFEQFPDEDTAVNELFEVGSNKPTPVYVSDEHFILHNLGLIDKG